MSVFLWFCGCPFDGCLQYFPYFSYSPPLIALAYLMFLFTQVSRSGESVPNANVNRKIGHSHAQNLRSNVPHKISWGKGLSLSLSLFTTPASFCLLAPFAYFDVYKYRTICFCCCNNLWRNADGQRCRMWEHMSLPASRFSTLIALFVVLGWHRALERALQVCFHYDCCRCCSLSFSFSCSYCFSYLHVLLLYFLSVQLVSNFPRIFGGTWLLPHGKYMSCISFRKCLIFSSY